MPSLRVATSAFPTSADVRSNAGWIRKQMRRASDEGADVVHFCEGALSGYVGGDHTSLEGFDWALLTRASHLVSALAGELGLTVVLGSTHRLSEPHKPHNSVYVLGPEGQIVDRYDKRFCAGPRDGAEELAHYAPGDHPCTVEVAGVRCGILICHEYRYPELFRQYVQMGVRVVFHSFHAAHVPPDRWAAMHAATGPENHRHHGGLGTLPGITMPATMISMAANNHLWISAANSSARQSCFGSFVVRPDGVMVGRVPRNRSGLLLTDIDLSAAFYDSTRAWRDRAIGGIFHSGRQVDDPRSADRSSF